MREILSRFTYMPLLLLAATFVATFNPVLSLFAETVTVTFDAALTNATGWTYSDKILLSSEGGTHAYFRSLNSTVLSPEYPFNITSATIRLSCSSTTPTRWLYLATSTGQKSRAAAVGAADRQECQTFLFDEKSITRTLKFSIEGSDSTGNWHIYSATISGIPIIAPPKRLQASNINGRSFSLSWENPGAAVSNRIDVATVLRSESTGTTIENFGFDEISAGGNPKDFAYFRGSLPPRYEKLSGNYLYAATNSTGLLQVSTSKNRGLLVHAGFDTYADLTLGVTLRRYNGDASMTTIAWTSGGAETNLIGTINLSDEFKAEFIDLSNAADGAQIVLNNSGKDDNHRVIIDEMSFIRGYSPELVETNVVATVFAARCPTTARGLSPNTEYLVAVSAFDAEGNESRPSDPLKVTTNDEGVPLTVRIR